jgi:hypothetical protein
MFVSWEQSRKIELNWMWFWFIFHILRYFNFAIRLATYVQQFMAKKMACLLRKWAIYLQENAWPQMAKIN